MRKKIEGGIKTLFRVVDDGALMMGQCLYVPNEGMVKRMVLRETHESKFTMHHGNTKIYQDLKTHYWWHNMKREIVEYMLKYNIFNKLK